MSKRITVLKPDPSNRALAGLSMGGIQTLYAGVNNTEMFQYLGVFSSGWIMPVQNNLADKQYEFMKENLDKINGNLNNSGFQWAARKTLHITIVSNDVEIR